LESSLLLGELGAVQADRPVEMHGSAQVDAVEVRVGEVGPVQVGAVELAILGRPTSRSQRR